MEVGCYTLDLYCDAKTGEHKHNEFPHQYIGQTRTECKIKARCDGWRWSINGKTLCPKCSKKDPRSIIYE